MTKKDKSLVAVDNPIFGYFKAICLSFYSRRLYIDVGKRWRGFGFLYTGLVVALFTIPLGISWTLRYQQFFDTNIIQPISQLPILYIQNGNLVFDKPMPFLIKNPDGAVTSIIDTTGTIQPTDIKYPDLIILITKNTIYFMPPKSNALMPKLDQNITQFTFSKNDNEVFDPASWVKNGNVLMIKYVTIGLVYPFIFTLFYSFIITFIPVMAFLGQLIGNIFFTFKLPFKQACRLMAVASTPGQLLFFVIIIMNMSKKGTGMAVVALLAAYFSYAIVILKRESKQVVIK